jgi:hypothetical protein
MALVIGITLHTAHQRSDTLPSKGTRLFGIF